MHVRNNEYAKKLARRINARMEELGLSQKDLSERCDLPQANISCYCLGNAIPKADSVVKLAHGLNMTTDDLIEYVMNDVHTTQQLCVWRKHNPYVPVSLPHPDNIEIDKVIFNDPTTIVLWSDGTKTVVKAENEAFDPEKGLAMAIAKKSLGNKRNYFEVFKKWVPKKEKPVEHSEPPKQMTYREKLQQEHPDKVSVDYMGGCALCPGSYGYGPEKLFETCINACEAKCTACWDKVIPDKKEG